MIKLSKSARIVRETTAPFEYLENGKTTTADIRVRFFGLSVKELKELRVELKAREKADPTDIIWLSETLFKRLESLPDLVGDDETPIPVTLEFLETLDLKNLKAIDEAIKTAESPK